MFTASVGIEMFLRRTCSRGIQREEHTRLVLGSTNRLELHNLLQYVKYWPVLQSMRNIAACESPRHVLLYPRCHFHDLPDV
jgi:hypothetical protein